MREGEVVFGAVLGECMREGEVVFGALLGESMREGEVVFGAQRWHEAVGAQLGAH